MKPSLSTIAAVAIFMLLAIFNVAAFADESAASVIAPSSIYYEIWTILQPIIVLLMSTVGPVLVTWIAARVISLLKITDQKQQLDIEVSLRNALHESAANALKYAVAKAGIPGGVLAPSVVTAAVDYVREKNPDAVAKLGVSQGALIDIIMSKAADIRQPK